MHTTRSFDTAVLPKPASIRYNHQCMDGDAKTQALEEDRAVETPSPALGPPRSTSARVALELLAVFALGVGLLQFIYLDARRLPATELGAPGFDSFYHTKMAAMLPEVGLVKDFPWLRFVYFSQHNDGFISHHYGFHMMLMPFVKASHWLTGDYLIGGRLAISVFFGLTLALMFALLIAGDVPWRWMWLIVFLLLPPDYFGRHAYIRAIAPSLMFMLGIVYLVFRERAVLAGIAIAAYVHLYLGSVVYTPLIVGTYAFSCLIGPRGDRRFPWRIVIWTTLGWLAGLRTYPYFDGAIEFLHMQIFGTGLDPDIGVGMEWNSYGNVWQFAIGMCGPLLAVWTASLVLRLRVGDRLNPRELTLVVLQFAFLALTLKAKRFIEYWPAFCMLSAAYMAAPAIRPVAAWFDPIRDRGRPVRAALVRLICAAGFCAVVLLAARRANLGDVRGFGREWQVWAIPAALMLAAWLIPVFSWNGGAARGAVNAVILLGVAAAFVTAGMFALHLVTGTSTLAAELTVGVVGWMVVAAVIAGVCLWTAKGGASKAENANLLARCLRASTVTVLGLAIFSLTALFGAAPASARQNEVYCGYNLQAIQKAMKYLKSVSKPGDVIFTDDWDVFPVYFYYNAHNNYIVGLDPKFTHWREPELWDRYVKLTRAQAPRDFESTWTDERGNRVSRKIRVEVTDIRDYFGAKYVMIDGDHKPMARMLSRAKDFARLVYPGTDYEKCQNAPYVIFEIIDASSSRSDRGTSRALYLSDLEPTSVEQGWGELHMDRSASDQPIELNGEFFQRGVGTHAPSSITYEIPDGYDFFEGIVGVSDASDGPGTIIARVLLDGKVALESAVLRKGSATASLRVDLRDAKTLTLVADPTPDGNQFDHVDWADARLTRKVLPSAEKTTRLKDRRNR